MTTHAACPSRNASSASGDVRERFRSLFQRSLRGCLRHGFPLPESFGLIFTETLEVVPLDPVEEQELYCEMLSWARSAPKLL